mgnify:CR=1 FL=1
MGFETETEAAWDVGGHIKDETWYYYGNEQGCVDRADLVLKRLLIAGYTGFVPVDCGTFLLVEASKRYEDGSGEFVSVMMDPDYSYVRYTYTYDRNANEDY